MGTVGQVASVGGGSRYHPVWDCRAQAVYLHEPPSVGIRGAARAEGRSLAWPLASFPVCLRPAFPASHLTISPPRDPAPGAIPCPRSHCRLLASPCQPPPWLMLFSLLGLLLLAWSSRRPHSSSTSWSHLLQEALHKLFNLFSVLSGPSFC